MGCDVLFWPENDEMYNGVGRLEFDFGVLDNVMEGKYRPGHFNGVALVVSKLLHIVSPSKAYFGQKDWQQCCIIQHLVDELKFNVEVCIVPTVREGSGLALSSRNLRLSESQKTEAVRIYDSLNEAKRRLLDGEKVSSVKQVVAESFAANEDIKLEYFELAASANLNLLDRVDESAKPILCIAAFVGNVRLIDNMFLLDN
jgi:pantoate--beta-alanine ligase